MSNKERKEETDDKIKSETNKEDNDKRDIVIIKDCKRKSENMVYIDERGRLCAATPPSVISNRTPPPPSQKHHFTQKHQINFCIDDIHRALSQREGADAVP